MLNVSHTKGVDLISANIFIYVELAKFRKGNYNLRKENEKHLQFYL